MKNGKKLAGFFAVLAAGLMAALPAFAEENPDCAALDRKHAKIISQIIAIFAESTGSPLVVKGGPEEGYTVEGSVVALNHSQEARDAVVSALEVAKNIMSIDESGCRYVKTAEMVDILNKAAAEYLRQVSNITHSL